MIEAPAYLDIATTQSAAFCRCTRD